MNQTIKTSFHRINKWALAMALGILWSSSLMAGTLTWNWSYSSASYSGSGTFTTDDTLTTSTDPYTDGYVGYLITGITGTWNGNTITSLAPLGSNYSDDLLGSAQPQLDADGVAFITSAGPDYFSLWNNGGSQSIDYWVYSLAAEIGQGNGSFTATLVEPAPVISNISLARTNVVLAATGGQSGKTCITLTSPDLSQWTPVATNVLSASGDFSITITNALNPALPQAFYRLLVQ
jgi:hypothetical protein